MEARPAEKESMLDMRLAEKRDLEALKEIWALCFGDPESYIDLYFATRDWTNETAVLLTQGRPVSMLAMIPVRMVEVDGSVQNASMIFAVATHPAYQKLGYADRLLEFANRHLAENQTMISLLVPAEEDLFRFYGKRGYSNGFFLREVQIKYSEIAGRKNSLNETNFSAAEKTPGPNGKTVMIDPIEPAEYNRIRKRQLTGSAWLDYRDDEILFEKQTAMMFGTDIFSVRFEQSPEGCFYAERASEDLVVVKELLVPEESLAAVLRGLAELMPAKEYIIRMPIQCGAALGGSIRAFGMLRNNRTDGSPSEQETGLSAVRSYLGIAYD